MPVVSRIPLATVTEDAVATDKDDESDTPEMDEEELGAHDEVVFEDLEDLEGDLVRVATEASLHDTSMIDSSGSHPTEEVVAKTSTAGVDLGTEGQIEATLDVQSSFQAYPN